MSAVKHAPPVPQPLTDAVVEGVPMRGSILNYRTAQVAALESWAGKLERDRARLLAALRAARDALRAGGQHDAADRHGYLLRELGEAA